MFNHLGLPEILIVIGVLLVSMSVHEAMHAYVGLKLGDETAAEKGRVSLNPLRHIDPFLTVILPAITLLAFGAPILAAKPVPLDPEWTEEHEFGTALIAFAGPASNLLLAVLGVALARLAGIDVLTADDLLGSILFFFIVLNVSLFVFNLIPIPPLDGSRVLYAFAPAPLQRLMALIEPYGFFIIFGLVLVGGFGGFVGRLNQGLLNFLL